jgi:hypothetical protein
MMLTADRPTPAADSRITAPLAAAPDHGYHPRRWLVLPVTLTAMLMAMLDSSASFSTSYQ